MVICPNCGAKNEEGEILCSECGSKLKGPVRQAKPIIPTEPLKFADAVAPKAESTQPEPVSADNVKSANIGSKWHVADLADEEPEKSRMTSGVVVLMVVIVAALFYGIIPTLINSYKRRPTGITLENYTFDVEVVDEDGKKEKITQSMKLFEGDSVRTETGGEAYLKLGAARSLMMLANTGIKVHKAQEATWIEMKRGALFFCIDNPYRLTETLELYGGNVSVSMHEATGYMYYDGKGEARIWIMNGEALVVVYDDEYGEQFVETLTPGEYAIGVFGDSGISCSVDKAFLEDLPSAMVRKIAETPELLTRVSSDTGWNRQDIIDLAKKYKDEEMQLNYIFPSWLPDQGSYSEDD